MGMAMVSLYRTFLSYRPFVVTIVLYVTVWPQFAVRILTRGLGPKSPLFVVRPPPPCSLQAKQLSLPNGIWLGGDWNRGSGQLGTVEIAGVEKPGVDNAVPDDRGGHRGSGKRGTKYQGGNTGVSVKIKVFFGLLNLLILACFIVIVY